MPLLTAAVSLSDAMALRDEEDVDGRAAPALERSVLRNKGVAATSPTRRSRGSAFRLPSDGERDHKHDDGDEEDDDASAASRPLSPRVRKRLDEAKENESVFCAVREQGEVVQWMSACHPSLIQFGRDLERRGFKTLSSVAFLTDDDVDASVDPVVRQHLLAMLTRLRHELFRM